MGRIIADYKAGKEHWITVAELLIEEQKEFETPKKWNEWLKEEQLDYRRATEMVRAYQILDKTYPEVLKDKTLVKISAGTIAKMPSLWSRLESKGLKYKDVLIDVTTGKQTYNSILTLVGPKVKEKKEIPNIQNEERKIQREINIDRSDGSDSLPKKFKLFVNLLSSINIVSDDILANEESIVELRNLIGSKCHEVASKLESIFNEQFFNRYKNKKEFNI